MPCLHTYCSLPHPCHLAILCFILVIINIIVIFAVFIMLLSLMPPSASPTSSPSPHRCHAWLHTPCPCNICVPMPQATPAGGEWRAWRGLQYISACHECVPPQEMYSGAPQASWPLLLNGTAVLGQEQDTVGGGFDATQVRGRQPGVRRFGE